MSKVLNIWSEQCTYKTAKCGCCKKTLKKDDLIVSVAKAQGSFSSVTNYHPECAEPILKETMKEVQDLMNNLITVSEKIDAHAKNKCNVEEIKSV